MAVPKQGNAGTDTESVLLQQMSTILAELKEQREKSFISKLSDSLPGVFIAVVAAALGFYIFVQTEFTTMRGKMEQVYDNMTRLEKILEAERQSTGGRLHECEKQLQQLEIALVKAAKDNGGGR